MKLYEVSAEDISEALAVLRHRLEAGALRLLETETDIVLVTAPTLAPFIEQLRKADIKNDIGKAGAETLAIILYRGPVGRAEIDRIRGVNSSFILRNLLIRGLIERAEIKKGSGYTFVVATALLQQLGVATQTELSDFSQIVSALDTYSEETPVSESTT